MMMTTRFSDPNNPQKLPDFQQIAPAFILKFERGFYSVNRPGVYTTWCYTGAQLRDAAEKYALDAVAAHSAELAKAKAEVIEAWRQLDEKNNQISVLLQECSRLLALAPTTSEVTA